MHAHAIESAPTSRPLRGIVFAKYGDLAASTRQRFVQAMPYLARDTITLEIHPLLSNAYLSQLFNRGTRSKWRMLQAYATRALQLLRIPRYDFIIVQYELFPYLPGIFESVLRLTGKPVFYDMDDAMFHQYDQHRNPLLRALLGNKLAPLLRRCDLAFCGNAYLAAYAQQYCKRTEIIPTTVDTELYQPGSTTNTTPVLGWIGSPSTWEYCQSLLDVIAPLAEAKKLSMLVVGAGHKAKARNGFEFRDWHEAREVTDIQQMDIGIMPIPDEPWARGKCGYKLIQYMACGIAVIASPVGVNREIVTHGVNGFLASTPAEWRAALDQLLADPTLRQRMGQEGRATIEQRYAIQHYGPRVAQLIRSVCGN